MKTQAIPRSPRPARLSGQEELANEEQVPTAAARERGMTPIAQSSHCYRRPTLGQVMKRKVSVAAQNPRRPEVSLSRAFALPALHPCPARVPAPPAFGGNQNGCRPRCFQKEATQPRASSVQADIGDLDVHPLP